MRERGFALLLVFALAASVAILIYLEIPRVAFERQRDKEALLIDRGEQYRRAIELFARKNNRYPQTLDDLEHAQTIRFLRRRYKDPMSGKDEWRLVHIDANGQYTDSKVHKPGGALDQKDSGTSVLASRIQGIGQSATISGQEGQVSAALQKRASDRISPGTPGAGSMSPGDPNQTGSPDGNADPNKDPNQQPNTTAAAGQTQASGQGGPNDPPRFQAGGQFGPNQSGQSASGASGQTATPAFGSVLPGPQQDASASASSANTSSTPGAGGATQQSGAVQAIQSMLGANRNAPLMGAGQGTPNALGAGLVGVATTVEMEGIRRYKDHSNYSEWEFIYDPNDVQGQGQAQGQGAGAQPGAANNTPGSNTTNSMFGGMPGGTPAPPAGGRFN